MPWPSFSPKVRLRDSGELQVATRSPRPASPANVVSSAPSAMPSRAVSASPRVISEARVLSPKPEPLGDAAGQRDDVLDRPAELAADHVGVGVRPEVRRVAGRLQRLGPVGVGAGDHGRGRLLLGDLAGQVRPGERRRPAPAPAPVTSQMTSLIRLVVPSSMPFISDSRVASGGQQRRPLRRGCPAATGTGRRGRRCRRPRSASAGVGGGAHRRRAAGCRAGSRRFSPSSVIAFGQLRPAGVQRHLAAGVGEHLGERGAPRARRPAPRRGSRGAPRARRRAARARGRGWKVGGAGSPRSSASWSRTRAMIRSVVSRSSSADSGPPARTSARGGGEVDRLADQVVGGRAEAQVQLLAVVVVHPLRAPLGHRQDDGVGGQRQPGHPGARLHRPPVGVAGDRALRVDHDDVAGVEVGLGRVERGVRVGREPGDRDLPGAAQQRAGERP